MGETNLATADEIAAATEKAPVENRPAQLIIDLGTVTFLESAGLNNLLTAQRIAPESGIDLRVIDTTGGPLRGLRITGLPDVVSPDAGTGNDESC